MLRGHGQRFAGPVEKFCEKVWRSGNDRASGARTPEPKGRDFLALDGRRAFCAFSAAMNGFFPYGICREIIGSRSTLAAAVFSPNWMKWTPRPAGQPAEGARCN